MNKKYFTTLHILLDAFLKADKTFQDYFMNSTVFNPKQFSDLEDRFKQARLAYISHLQLYPQEAF